MTEAVFTGDQSFLSRVIARHALPLEAIKDIICFSSRDWSENRGDAWLYGIVIGWDDGAMMELASKFDWGKSQIDLLKELHGKFVSIAANQSSTKE